MIDFAGALPLAQMPHASNGAVRILLVEDDPLVHEVLQAGLEQQGYRVDVATKIARARRLIRSGGIDLVVLDLGLPDGSGLDLCAEIRGAGPLPVILISGKHTLDDRLAGFDAGADDYMIKPLALVELSRRVEAVLRRTGLRPASDVLAGPHGLTLCLSIGEALVGARRVQLTRSETGLLRVLLERAGAAASDGELCRRVWNYETVGDPNFLHQHVSRLRRKLKTLGLPDGLIQTVYGVGYAIVEQPATAFSQPDDQGDTSD